MPSAKTQRYLMWLGITGTLVSCFGCSLAFRNEIDASRAFLIVAWLILVPLFAYLIMLRSRASARYRRRLRPQEARLAQENERLARVDDILEAGGVVRTEPDEETLEPQAEGTK